MCEAVGGLAETARPFRDFTTVFLLFWNFLLNALYKSALFYMTRSWRVPMIVTSHFPTYESIILSKNLNNKKKLTGWVTPTVQSCLNLIWIKSYDINHNLIWKLCFSILEEKTLKIKFQKWPFLDPLWSFFVIYIDIFHKTEIQTVILRCLVCLNLNWVKSYFIIIG